MKSNQDFKNEALAALRGNWAPAILATVAILAIESIVISPGVYSSIHLRQAMAEINPTDPAAVMQVIQSANSFSSIQFLLSVFLLFPLTIGFVNAFKLLLQNGDNKLTANTFRISFSNYWHKVWGYFLMYILIMLWSLLLIIPGIIKALSYAMTPYILEDNPELSASDAIHLSRTMMKGHKFDLFYLFLGFLGWLLLSILTLGIGLLWLIPYMQTAFAAFYQEVKDDMGDDFEAQIRATANL